MRASRPALALCAAAMLAVTGGAWVRAQEGEPSAVSAPPAMKVRIADLARVEGLRSNQLIGIGLVVGLNGSGDSRTSPVHVQMVSNMLRAFGLTIDPVLLRPRNVAAVSVTATLPPLARPGDRIDATVSSLGDARSLAGGVLLQTPLEGADGQVYAVAQGMLTVGGSDSRASMSQRVHPTVARAPAGAIVERAVEAPVVHEGTVRLVLYEPDFTTARRMVEAINGALGNGTAYSDDGAVVTVRLMGEYRNDPVGLMAFVQQLSVTPAVPARVVINERTGTVVLGHEARIAPVAVAHGGIHVSIGATAGAGGSLETTTGTWPATEPTGHMTVLDGSATIGELVDALNAAGVGPKDVIAILEAIRSAGALWAQLEVN